jgi:hypothetical protein
MRREVYACGKIEEDEDGDGGEAGVEVSVPSAGVTRARSGCFEV